MVSGIIYVIRHRLRWKGAPRGYGQHKTLSNRFICWSRLGVFARIFAALAAKAGVRELLMIKATQFKAHRTAASLDKKGGGWQRFRRHSRWNARRGFSLLYRVNQGWPELKAPRRV